MKYKYLLAVFFSVTVASCGTLAYKPQEYPLRDGLIEPLKVAGDVQINNAQPSKDQAIVYSYGGTKLASNYHDITEVMVEQTKKELNKHTGEKVSGGAKNIDISVNYLLSTYKIMHWNSEIRFTVKLGNGEVVNKTVTHGSGGLLQDLNGCIAEAVIYLFKDEKVRAYIEGK
jgi:hypothetical protein